MATFTIENDKQVRAQLRGLAAALRKRYNGTQWQGDWENATTSDTFGDRLQVPTQYTAKDGTRYLLVLNLLVARNAGGRLSARVSAWRLSENTGEPVGYWPVTARDTDSKGGRLHNTYLTPAGFIQRIGNQRAHFDIVRRLPHVLSDAKALLDAGITGKPVVTVHTDRNGENPYDTTESHLLPFGGYVAAAKRLAS